MSTKKTGMDELAAMDAARTALQRAAQDYEDACHEYHKLWAFRYIPEESLDHYVNTARARNSQWSGGHTVANLCEQIERNVCLELANKSILGLAQR